ncbi:MAG: hypothetical protein R3C68_12400 [Myxococcota bacterium]
MFGWHEWWIETHAGLVLGKPTLHDDMWLGQALRGVFGTTFYTRRLFGASTEFRLSVVRNHYKIGFFSTVQYSPALQPQTPMHGSPLVLG